ncbi:DUF2911 domain-containing protein [Aquimarina sp. ERC-38]|uniref:DUF2911 domain-containing protein n=1 Tax=Aquimarina sp. ERC-38 TaxID=2949996 RepID=UPI0022453AE2|nr:DUF2911 domain-containing protein [Aquimarina sp. ERC-38]UZO80507.1 DUF2911 domain-containing protein [Aquimarina sp. ERC-38]
MKKLIACIAIFCMTLITNVQAQKFADMQKSPTDIAYAKKSRDAKPDIKVIYSRPQKKDREVFGKLVPYGKVWRTGADEATEIKLFKDVKLGDTTVKAGTYSLFTIPGEKEWTVILNSDLDSWGAYTYDESKNVATIKVPVQESKSSLEAFSVAFKDVDKGYHMFMGWDDTLVEIPFYF